MVRKLILLMFCVLGIQISFGQLKGTQIEQQYVSFDKGFIWDMDNMEFKFFPYFKNEPVYFKFKDVSSDFGPRRYKKDGEDKYDFHGGIDFARTFLKDDAVVALGEGIVNEIHVTGNENDFKRIKQIIIESDSGVYGYGYRHLFCDEDGNPSVNNTIEAGNFVMGIVDGKYYILNTITSIALCENSGIKLQYNKKEYITTNVVKKGQLIAPIGNSGGYKTHLHLEFLENPNHGFGDKNALNPLHYLEYSTDFYSDYVVIPTYKKNGKRKRKSISLGGNDKMTAIYEVLVQSSNGGSTYDNCVLDINEVEMEIANEVDMNFQTVIGTSNDLRISYGGLPNQKIYPSYISGRYGIGGVDVVGVYPYAYNEGDENNQAYDKFFFPGFIPGISFKDTYNNKGTTMARYIGEARYPDGDYFLRGRMTTVKKIDKVSENHSVNIDNFNPYVVYCDVNYHGIGSRKKELIEINNRLVYEESGGHQFFTGNGALSLSVKTSEPVKSLSVAIEDITTTNLQLFNLDGDRTFWMIFDVGFSGVSLEDKTLTFFAEDMNGNSLVIHPDQFEGHLVQNKLSKLYKDFTRFISGRDKSTGYDQNHSIRFSDISEPDIIFNSFDVHDGDGQGSGNNNGQVEIGEGIDLDVRLKNNGEATAYNLTATLHTNNSFVSVGDSYETWADINPGESVWSNEDFDFTVQEGFIGDEIDFILNITSDEGSWTQYFSIPVFTSGGIGLILELDDLEIHDGIGGGVGNEDGNVNPGEEIDLDMKVRNSGDETATNVIAVLYTNDTYVDIIDNEEYFNDIQPGESIWCNSDFDFTVSGDCPEKDIEFWVYLIAENYSRRVDFSIHVYVDETPGFYFDGINVHDGIGGGSGNENGEINLGEEIDLDIKIGNFGSVTATSVSGTLTTDNPEINIIDNHETWEDIPVGESIWCNSDFDFTVPDDYLHGFINFTLHMEADGHEESMDFGMTVYIGEPDLRDDAIWVHDGDGYGGEGDGDHIPEAGEEIDLDVRLENNGNGVATNISAHLSVDNSDIDITDDYETWYDIYPEESLWCKSDFDFSIPLDFNSGEVRFTLDIEADGYSSTEHFDIYIYGDKNLKSSNSLEKVSSFVGKEEFETNYKSFVSPNPIIDISKLNIFLDKELSFRADLYNINGFLLQHVFSGKGQLGFNSIPLKIDQNVSSGVYFLRIISENKQESIRIMIINN